MFFVACTGHVLHASDVFWLHACFVFVACMEHAFLLHAWCMFCIHVIFLLRMHCIHVLLFFGMRGACFACMWRFCFMHGACMGCMHVPFFCMHGACFARMCGFLGSRCSLPVGCVCALGSRYFFLTPCFRAVSLSSGAHLRLLFLKGILQVLAFMCSVQARSCFGSLAWCDETPQLQLKRFFSVAGWRKKRPEEHTLHFACFFGGLRSSFGKHAWFRFAGGGTGAESEGWPSPRGVVPDGLHLPN